MNSKSTLIIHWVFSICTIFLISLRLILKKFYGRAFIFGDFCAVGALFSVFARLALIHVVILWGTNNMSAEHRSSHSFTQVGNYHRQVGSKLVLVDRVLYNTYLWLQKLVLLDAYRRLVHMLSWERLTLWAYYFIFLATFIAVQVVTFTECQPFAKYWTVTPNPGKCSEAQTQLLVMGILNICTDIMLIILPMPILIIVRRPLAEKLHLGVLFAIGFFIVAITVIRLPQNSQQSTEQKNRTAWASAELFSSAVVANAPVVYGYCKRREQTGDPITDRRWSRPPDRAYPQSNIGNSNTNILVNIELLSTQDSESCPCEIFEVNTEESFNRENVRAL